MISATCRNSPWQFFRHAVAVYRGKICLGMLRHRRTPKPAPRTTRCPKRDTQDRDVVVVASDRLWMRYRRRPIPPPRSNTQKCCERGGGTGGRSTINADGAKPVWRFAEEASATGSPYPAQLCTRRARHHKGEVIPQLITS